MKKVFIIFMLFIATTLKLEAEDYSIIYVVQYNEVSTYVISYDNNSRSWGVYSLDATYNLCPTICGVDELLYSNEDRSLCMEWALTDLGYDIEGFPRYWGDYQDRHEYYVINNYSYDYVNNFVKTELMCPTNCGSSRNANNLSTDFISFIINSEQVYNTEIPVNENVSISIYDYSGKLIYSKSILVDSSQINIEKNLVSGVYFINFSSLNFSKTIKAVVN